VKEEGRGKGEKGNGGGRREGEGEKGNGGGRREGEGGEGEWCEGRREKGNEGEGVIYFRYNTHLLKARKEGFKKGFFSSLVVGMLYFVAFSTFALGFW
jgi:hypothetical protein